MRKGLIRGLKGLCCVALAAAISLTGIQVPHSGGQGNSTVKVAEAASTTGRVPMWAYMKSGSGKLTTYTTNTLKSSTGYIVPGDYCKILAFYSNGSVKVTYPVSKGYRTAYASMSGFMASTGFTTQTRTLGKKLTAYRRSTGSATIGTVYASDQVIVVGTANGRTQVQYPCSGGYKLGWVPGTYSASTQAAATSAASVANGTYKLVSALNNNYVMDVYGGYASDGTNVQLYADNNSNAQKFVFTRQSDGYYTIKNAGSGKMLDCYGAGKTNGTNIQQYTSNSSAAQRWKVTHVGNGYYTLTCKCNGLLADVSGGRSANGTNIQMYSANGSAAQKWKLVSTAVSNSAGTGTVAAPTTNNQALGAPVPAGCKFNMKTYDNGWYGFHDINRGVSTGTPVYAIADGTVTYKQAYTNYSGGKRLTSYGNFIEFRSANGVYTAKYCHLNRFNGVSQIISSSMTKKASGSQGVYNLGTKSVKKGQVIGYIGTTGNSSGVHLHFELRKNGTRIDPTTVIKGLY